VGKENHGDSNQSAASRPARSKATFASSLRSVSMPASFNCFESFEGHRHVNELGVTERLIAGYDDRP
jgi:hypothetical protein